MQLRSNHRIEAHLQRLLTESAPDGAYGAAAVDDQEILRKPRPISDLLWATLDCHRETRVLCGAKDLCTAPASCTGPSPQRTRLRMTNMDYRIG